MFILNPENIQNKFQCDEDLAMRLIREYKIPILSKKQDIYYFSKTDKLKNILKKLNIKY